MAPRTRVRAAGVVAGAKDDNSKEPPSPTTPTPTTSMATPTTPAAGSDVTAKRKLKDLTENSESNTPTKRKRKGKLARKECILCCNDVAVNQFPKLPHDDADAHDRSVCIKCWNAHLISEVSSKGWDAVSCPQCTKVLSEAEMRKLASGTTYKEWLDKAAKACGESNEEYRPCPRAECSWACFFCTKEDDNIFTCQECKYRHCVLCEVVMHDDETCAQYQARMSEEANTEERKKRQVKENEDSEKFVGTVSKPCPNCGRHLDKFTGCDHVTCSSCRHEFCRICFARYQGREGINAVGNSAHRQTCHYHPQRLPNMDGPPPEEDSDAESF